MLAPVKRILIWSILFILLDYYRISIVLFNSCLSLVYFEYREIFRKICYSQTSSNEEELIGRLSGSIFPQILNQILMLSLSFAGNYPERTLCIFLLFSIVIVSSSRIYQYSYLCIEGALPKGKNKKSKTNEDDYDYTEVYKWVRISALCFYYIMGDLLFIACIAIPYSYSIPLMNLPDGKTMMFITLLLSLSNRIVTSLYNGQTKVFYHISPEKTLEGILLMFIANLIITSILRIFRGVWLIPDIDYLDFIAISLIVSVAGIIGSMGGSFIKRVAMVKDSAYFFQSLHGFFDQIDYLIFAFPATYYYTIYSKYIT